MRLSILCFISLSAVAACAPAQAQRADALLRNADANQDGDVTREEFRVSRATQFRRLDRDNDGVAMLSEMPRLANSNRPEARALRTLLTRADRDGDGRITRAEFVDGPSPLFEAADADQDGRLSSEEIAGFRDQQ